MGDISSGTIKSVDVFNVDCEVEGVEYEDVLREELPATSELQAQSEVVPFVTAVLLCTGVVLFCWCIEIKVFKNISVQGMQAGNHKATCRNFSCLHFQVCITKEFRYFVMCYCTLILQQPTPYFLSIVVLQWCHECFV